MDISTGLQLGQLGIVTRSAPQQALILSVSRDRIVKSLK